ncbi:MAG: hypothetical protein ACFB0E_04235 [Leptolyngbyaceae cyanobacterium]
MHRALIFSIAIVAGGTLVINQAVSQPATDSDFESLSACGKLDAIARAGKSVPDYITGSGYRQFDDEIRSTCTWHLESLNVALNRVGRDPAFEALTACQKLDAIDRAGKSVAQYIAGSGIEDFDVEIINNCPQYRAALDEAGGLRIGGGPQEISYCASLDLMKSEGESPSEIIARSLDIENTSKIIADECPEYQSDLEQAKKIQQNAVAIESIGGGVPFSALSPCTQLDIIENEPNKNIIDYIVGSGIEIYANAVRSNCTWHLSVLEEAERRTYILFSNFDGKVIDPEFEASTPCQKLDVIDEVGKSVPQYITNSGIEDFFTDIESRCRRHFESLTEAR